MNSRIYLRCDIALILSSIAYTSKASERLTTELLGDVTTPEQERLIRVHREAVRSTLVSVGLAFGLEPVAPQVQPGVSPALAGLLWAESEMQ